MTSSFRELPRSPVAKEGKLFFAQKAFIVDQQTLLMVRKSQADPHQPGKWEVPGGRMQFGEEIDSHLAREVKEEVGLEVSPGEPFHIWQWRLNRKDEQGTSSSAQVVAVARICTPLSLDVSSANQVADDYIDTIKWVPFDDVLEYDLIRNMVPAVQVFLKRLAMK